MAFFSDVWLSFYFHPRHLQIIIALCMASLALVCRCNTSRMNQIYYSFHERNMSIELYIFPVPPPLDVPIHVSEVYNDPDILFVVYVC